VASTTETTEGTAAGSEETNNSKLATPTTPASDTVSDTNSSTPINEQPPPGLTEVHIIGTKYIDYFIDGTTTTSYPGDPAIDDHFHEPNAPIPTHDGLVWVHTTGQPLYDTPSGDLEVDDYAVRANGSIIANYVFVSSTSTPDTSSTSTDALAPEDAAAVSGTSTNASNTTEDASSSTATDTVPSTT